MEVKVRGNSMLPTLSDGQTVELKEYKEYKKDDIVAFSYGGTIWIKRIGYIKDDRFYAESDNDATNVWGDRLYITSDNYFGLIPLDCIIGAVPRTRETRGTKKKKD